MNFYLVLRHHTTPPKADPARVADHLAWLRNQHERGTVLISGPSSDGMTGIYVVRAASRPDAEALAATDPLALIAQTRIEVIDWQVHQIIGIGSFDAGALAGS